MAHVVLFHSVLGLRPVEHKIAAALEEHGHVITLPDLYDGRSATHYDTGFELKDKVGEVAIHERVLSALHASPETAVLAGVSFGAFLLGRHWTDRPRMPGAVLIAGGAPWMEPRRAGLPVSAHIARPDPFDDEAEIMGWAQEAGEVVGTMGSGTTSRSRFGGLRCRRGGAQVGDEPPSLCGGIPQHLLQFR